MKALIHESFPSHDIFGEEGGMEPGRHPEETTSPKYLWVIDPIDGTKSFITGVTPLSTKCSQGCKVCIAQPCICSVTINRAGTGPASHLCLDPSHV